MSNDHSKISDTELFRQTVGDIKPLNPDTVLHKKKPNKAKVKRQIWLEEKSPDSNKNQQIYKESYFSFHMTKVEIKKMKSGNIMIDASIDLHGLNQFQAISRLKSFVAECLKQNIRYASVIHGKGLKSSHGSVLKPIVLQWLQGHQNILAYCPAIARDGGLGATYFHIDQ